MIPEPVAVTMKVVDVLDRLGAPYLVGGSMAAAAHGVVRATVDADLVVELRPEHAGPLVSALLEEFYIDDQSVREAIDRRSSFNAIHLETMFKVDIFVSKQRPFDRERFRRRARKELGAAPAPSIYVGTAEDTILAKLEWYRLGGEVSERQWRDVLALIAAQRHGLDLAHMRKWAGELGVADLLERALSEAHGA